MTFMIFSIGIYILRPIKIIASEILVTKSPGLAFTKGLRQVLGLNV